MPHTTNSFARAVQQAFSALIVDASISDDARAALIQYATDKYVGSVEDMLAGLLALTLSEIDDDDNEHGGHNGHRHPV